MGRDESALSDALGGMNVEASRDGNAERALAVMVRRFFRCPERTVRVAWQLGMYGAKGLEIDGTDAAQSPWDPANSAMTFQWSRVRDHRSFSIRFGRDPASHSWAVELGAAPLNEGEVVPRLPRLVVQVNGPHSERTADRIAFFERYLTGQIAVYQAARALKSAAMIGRWAGEVDAVANTRDASLVERLRRASGLVDELARAPWSSEGRRLIERLARWAVHEHLGTGWGVKRIVGDEAKEFCDKLREAGLAWSGSPPSVREKENTAPERLEVLRDMLGPIPTLPEIQSLAQENAGPNPWRLLRLWCWLQEVARAENPAGKGEAERRDTWDKIACAGIADLASVAALFWTERVGAHAQGADIAFLRSWLQLWFAIELLRNWPSAGTLLPSERWRVRADVAYAIRESLRFALMGRDPDYRFQPTALAAALRTAVAHHAHKVVAVPRELDVSLHLRAVAETPARAGYHFAMGHLQHVLDMYVLGCFLAELEILRGDGLPAMSMGRLLAAPAGTAGPHLGMQVRSSFAMAALFHDVGMMLVGAAPRLQTFVFRDDEDLRNHIDSVAQCQEGAADTLMSKCLAELTKLGCLADSSPEWQAWIERQRAAHWPDHSLLGAWYLYRIGRGAMTHAGDSMRSAIRAVLLHGASECPIDSAKDPVAALLVLCDEVFEWEPLRRAPPGPNAVSRTPLAMAVDVEPHVSRAARVRFHDVTVSAEGEKLTAKLDVRQNRNWPSISIVLRHPEFLDVPVYRTWIMVSQNLARIGVTEACWGPEMNLYSAVPERVQPSRAILSEAILETKLPVRAVLEPWLTDDARFASDVESLRDLDCVHVRAGDPLALTTVRRSLEQFADEIERAQQEHAGTSTVD